MSSFIHYKFVTYLSYRKVHFDGSFIPLGQLKQMIMVRERLHRNPNHPCDLLISNAQTQQEYTDEGTQIPGLTSVTVQRIPDQGQCAGRINGVVSERNYWREYRKEATRYRHAPERRRSRSPIRSGSVSHRPAPKWRQLQPPLLANIVQTPAAVPAFKDQVLPSQGTPRVVSQRRRSRSRSPNRSGSASHRPAPKRRRFRSRSPIRSGSASQGMQNRLLEAEDPSPSSVGGKKVALTPAPDHGKSMGQSKPGTPGERALHPTVVPDPSATSVTGPLAVKDIKNSTCSTKQQVHPLYSTEQPPLVANMVQTPAAVPSPKEQVLPSQGTPGMSSRIYYKFAAYLSYRKVHFNGSYITLGQLKQMIMVRERLHRNQKHPCDLLISNAQSQEEYTDEGTQIPGLTSVTVQRIPVQGQCAGSINGDHSYTAEVGTSCPAVNDIKNSTCSTKQQVHPLYSTEQPPLVANMVQTPAAVPSPKEQVLPSQGTPGMSSRIYYKFAAYLSYRKVIFNGSYITLGQLKQMIMVRERLHRNRKHPCDLLISNAQSQEEYTDEGTQIPGLTSVTVQRIPVQGQCAGSMNGDHSKTAEVGTSSPAVNDIKNSTCSTKQQVHPLSSTEQPPLVADNVQTPAAVPASNEQVLPSQGTPGVVSKLNYWRRYLKEATRYRHTSERRSFRPRSPVRSGSASHRHASGKDLAPGLSSDLGLRLKNRLREAEDPSPSSVGGKKVALTPAPDHGKSMGQSKPGTPGFVSKLNYWRRYRKEAARYRHAPERRSSSSSSPVRSGSASQGHHSHTQSQPLGQA